MKHLLCIVLLSAVTTAWGADFRLLDFGESCADIVAKERSHDSSLLSQDDTHYIFMGEHLGHAVTISYECPDDRFRRGIFIFRFEDFSAAKRFFSRQKANFIAFYGVPDLDQGSEIYADQMGELGFEIKDEHKYMLGWELPDKNILFGASPVAGSDGGLVTIDVAPSQR